MRSMAVGQGMGEWAGPAAVSWALKEGMGGSGVGVGQQLG